MKIFQYQYMWTNVSENIWMKSHEIIAGKTSWFRRSHHHWCSCTACKCCPWAGVRVMTHEPMNSIRRNVQMSHKYNGIRCIEMATLICLSVQHTSTNLFPIMDTFNSPCEMYVISYVCCRRILSPHYLLTRASCKWKCQSPAYWPCSSLY